MTRQQPRPIVDRETRDSAPDQSRPNTQRPPDRANARPSDRTADQLAAAEHSLRELDDQVVHAKRAWADAMRASGNGTGTPQQVMAAQAALEGAENARRLERERIDALRLRLYDQRRREILMERVSGQDMARIEARRNLAEKDGHRSFLSRLFGRK